MAAILLAWALLRLGLPRPLAHGGAFLVAILAILGQVSSLLTGEGWGERLVDLATRLNAWAYAARSGGINTDPLVFFLFLLAFAWLVGYLFAWFSLRARSPWWGVVPCGLVLLVNLTYAPPQLGGLFLAYMVSSLLLLIYLNQQGGNTLEVARGSRFFGYSAAVGLSLALLAWLAPVPGEARGLVNLWYRVNAPWQEGLGQMNRLFAFLMAKGQPGPSAFDKVLVLRGASNLSDEPVMVVEASEGRYWRGLSYDYYTGQGWLTREQRSLPTSLLGRYSSFLAQPYAARKEMTQTVTVLAPKNNLIFAAGQPQRVVGLGASVEASRPSPVAVRTGSLSSPASLPADIRPYASYLKGALEQVGGGLDSSRLVYALNRRLPWPIRVTRLMQGDGGEVEGLVVAAWYPLDVTALYAATPLQIGQQYQVVSSVSQASASQLRGAGTDYPSWVVERYLQLPASLPQRVRALAQRLTEGAKNPYDKALAIEGYLRGLSYATFIPPPPGNVDRVDYLLFTLKRGYSAYFSTAMVVMLRSVGVPARLVTGYSTGEYDPDAARYTVRESNAHGWVEVFFPGYGWIEFEPTPSLAPIVRPQGGEEGPPAEDSLSLEELEVPEQGVEAAMEGGQDGLSAKAAGLDWRGFWWLSGIVLLGAVGMGLTLAWRWRWAGLDPAVEIYGKMVFLASLARLGPKQSQTPQEYARSLQGVLPQRQGDIERIVAMYEKVRYGVGASTEEEGRRLRSIWRVLRRDLWRGLWATRRGE
jgi:hypothetical protein